MATIRTPKDSKSKSSDSLKGEESQKIAKVPHEPITTRPVLDKIFDASTREIRSMTAKRTGAIPKTSQNIAFEIPINDESDPRKSEDTYLIRAMYEQIMSMSTRINTLENKCPGLGRL